MRYYMEAQFVPAAKPIRMGIDVGSTTVKVVALDSNDKFFLMLTKGIAQIFETQSSRL